MRDIVILHENEEWLVPLRAEFEKRGVEAKEWFLDTGVIPFTELPDDAVYYNRMSASSHTRGHRFAARTHSYGLNLVGKQQSNGCEWYRRSCAEVCKLSQYAALQKAGLNVPKHKLVVGKSLLVEAAETFAQWPVILKPNRGGKGLGVIKFDDAAGLQAYIDSADYEEPLDGVWLLQEYIKPKQPHITRSEFVGQKFVYAVNVNTEQGFELCPADVCSVDDAFCPTSEAPAETPNKFTITKRFNDHEIIFALEAFLKANDIDVAGIEFIEDEKGELYV